VKRKKLDSRATAGIFVAYSISTKQYFVYDPFAKTLHHSRDVLSREGKWYRAPNAADKAIWDEHFYGDVIEEPKLTEKQPTRDGSSEHQKEEPLEDDSPPDPPKQKKKSRELAGLETSLGDAWKPPVEVSHRNRAGKDMLAESAQLALEDEEFEDMIPIYAAAAISNDHEDGMNNPKLYKSANESPLADKWDTLRKEELDAIGHRQVFGDFMELPEGRKAFPSHWVYKNKRDGAGDVQRFMARLVGGDNHQSNALTIRLSMHRLLASATSGWHLRSPPSTISRSINWTYAWLSRELSLRKRYICTCRRDILHLVQTGCQYND